MATCSSGAPFNIDKFWGDDVQLLKEERTVLLITQVCQACQRCCLKADFKQALKRKSSDLLSNLSTFERRRRAFCNNFDHAGI